MISGGQSAFLTAIAPLGPDRDKMRILRREAESGFLVEGKKEGRKWVKVRSSIQLHATTKTREECQKKNVLVSKLDLNTDHTRTCWIIESLQLSFAYLARTS
jgi:hypothetical protein